jgi:hypothetical protein
MHSRRLVVSVLVAGLLAASLAACAPSSTPPAASDAPESAQPADTSGEESRDEQRERLSALTWEEFASEPAVDRRDWALWELGLYADRHQVQVIAPERGPAYYGMYVDDDKDPRELDGQTILNNFHYVLGDSRISVAADEESFDHDRAIKVLSAAFYDTNEATAIPEYAAERTDLLEHTERFFYSDEKFTVVSEVPAFEGLDNDGNEILLKDIVYDDESGTRWTARFACTDQGSSLKDYSWLLMTVAAA